MIGQTTKVNIIIASQHCLINFGIQYFIDVCGVDSVYLDFKSLENTLVNQNERKNYLIVHHRLLGLPNKDFFNQLLFQFRGKILVIGSAKMDSEFHQHIIFPSDDHQIVISKLRNFFGYSILPGETTQNDVLSSREIDVLKEVALGYPNKEIADRLFISINTVITHRKNITEKLGIKTISGLTVYALMNNLIHPNDVNI